MASTKEIFSKGLNYILREIKDGEEMYETGMTYLKLVEGKLSTTQRAAAQKHIEKIRLDLAKIKEQIRRSKADYNYYVKEYGYTEDELNNKAKNQKFHIHPATDEELQADYERDMKECEYDKKQAKGNYTELDHNNLIDRVNEFNMANDLPMISY